jgi:hypothetical protein
VAQVNSAGNTPAEQQAVSAVTTENAAAVAALLVLEKQALDRVTSGLRQILNELFRRLSAKYVLLTGALANTTSPQQADQLRQILIDGIQDLATQAQQAAQALAQAAQQALARGREYANRYLSDPVDDVSLPAEVQQLIDGLPAQIEAKIDDATRAIEQLALPDWDSLVKAVGRANQVPNSVTRTVTTAVNRANSSAVRQVAVERGASVLWVAEPDACVICLALSGHIIDPMSGDGFDEEATFGRPGSAPDVWPPGQPLMEPPRHPNCRCHPELWFGPHVAPGGPEETSLYNRPGIGERVDLAAALRREAKRSVLYGWSLESESNNTRLYAARRLLSLGAGLPKSVEERAHLAVARGQFEGRVHPSKRRTAHRQ